MEWLVIIVIAGFIYYHFVLVKGGNIKFWKAVSGHPEEAYLFFQNNSCFIIFDVKPPGGYLTNLPAGEWEGPFKLYVPSIDKTLTIYGRTPEYQIAQKDFTRNFS